MFQVAVNVATFPIFAPLFNLLVERRTFALPVVERQPLTELLMMTGVKPICRFFASESRSTLTERRSRPEALGGRENVSDGVPCSQMP